jgi:hypothetical protein
MSKQSHASMSDYVDLGYKVAEWLGSTPRADNASEMKAIAQREAKRVLRRETEFKIKDTGVASPTNITTTPSIQNLTAIAQGVADNQRIGDEARIHKIELKVAVFNNASARSQQVRFVLARFKPQSTAAPYPTAATYFDVAVTNPVLDFQTHDMRTQWHVLWDQSFAMSDTGSNRVLMIDKVFKLDTRIDFDPAVATGSNQYFFLVLGSDGTNYPTYQMNSRVTFSNA